MKFFNFQGQRNLCGTIIRLERTKRKMSQIELANRMNAFGLETNTNTISNIELGYRILTDYELIVLSRIFEIPVSSFFTEVDKLTNKELANLKYTPPYNKTNGQLPTRKSRRNSNNSTNNNSDDKMENELP